MKDVCVCSPFFPQHWQHLLGFSESTYSALLNSAESFSLRCSAMIVPGTRCDLSTCSGWGSKRAESSRKFMGIVDPWEQLLNKNSLLLKKTKNLATNQENEPWSLVCEPVRKPNDGSMVNLESWVYGPFWNQKIPYLDVLVVLEVGNDWSMRDPTPTHPLICWLQLVTKLQPEPQLWGQFSPKFDQIRENGH